MCRKRETPLRQTAGFHDWIHGATIARLSQGSLRLWQPLQSPALRPGRNRPIGARQYGTHRNAQPHPGHPGHFRRRAAQVRPRPRDLRPCPQALLLPARRHPGVRSDGRVRPLDGRDQRRRLEGDVHVRGQGRRPDHAAPRIHRRHLPRLYHRGLAAICAAQARHQRPGVPLRAPAKGPLPPVPPARRRDPGRRRAGRRRGAARPCRPAAARAGHRGRHPPAQHAGRRRDATPGAPRCSRISRRTGTS